MAISLRGPEIGADDATVGTAAWTNPGNVTVNDSTTPAEATVSSAIVNDASVKLVVGGVISGNDLSNAQQLNTVAAFYSYGGSSELAGLVLTPADINNANFGAVISYKDSLGVQTHYVKATDYGFSIPSTATINGVLIEVGALNRNTKGGHFADVYFIRITITYTLSGGVVRNTPFIYDRAKFRDRINAKIQNRIGLLVSSEDLMDEVVRTVNTDVDLRSMRRKSSLVPNLFHGPMEYLCPTDFSSGGIIDVPQQAKREDGSFFYVPTEEFYVRRERGAIALDNFNGTNLILINSRVQDVQVILSELDSLTSGGGSWTAYGDAINLSIDDADFFRGNGSLAFDINANGGTTAGIQNLALNIFDITDYLGGDSAIFVYAKITSITDLTNYILQFGDDASNYRQKTVTMRNDGTAFQNGWNLLRFDLSSLTTVGNPSKTGNKFVRCFMTKAGTKINESSYKFDFIVLRKGKTADLKYYGNFGWQTLGGAYLENSTDDSDVIVCSNDEFQLFLLKGKQLALDEVSDPQNAIDQAQKDYMDAVKEYKMNNPSEAKIQTSQYYDYGEQNYNGSNPRERWTER